MTTIENKELKGITLKLAITVIVATASLIISLFAVYGGIKEQISEVNTKIGEQNSKIQEQIRLDDLMRKFDQERMNKMELEINKLKEDIDRGKSPRKD